MSQALSTAHARGGTGEIGVQQQRRRTAIGSVILLCAGSSVPLLLLGCGFFGLGLGNITSLPLLIAQTEFNIAEVSRVAAFVTAISQAGYAFAPAIFGLLRDLGSSKGRSSLPGGAALLFAAAGLIQIAAAGTVLLGRGPSPRTRPAKVRT